MEEKERDGGRAEDRETEGMIDTKTERKKTEGQKTTTNQRSRN